MTILNKAIAIVGQGYVGLPLAMATARAGWQVHGIEIASEKFEFIAAKKSPVEDVQSIEISRLMDNGSYFVHQDFSAIEQAAIVILCVPTPIDQNHLPDLKPLASACDSVKEFISPGTLLINESTSFPGTLRNFIEPRFAELSFGDRLFFATAPERIDPGNKSWNQENTPRLIGGLSKEGLALAVDFYRSFCNAVVPVTSPEVAEIAKLLENSFRLINISFINELSIFAGKLGVDVREVVDAASTKPYGYMPFRPSAGIGGHCIPVDPHYLLQTMREVGMVSPVLESAAKSNIERPAQVLESAIELAGGNPKRILIVGVAYKSGISDTREGAAEKIAQIASARGIEVFWHDSLVTDWPYAIRWNGDQIDLAIVTVNQPGDEEIIEKIKSPIADCTGAWKGKPQVSII